MDRFSMISWRRYSRLHERNLSMHIRLRVAIITLTMAALAGISIWSIAPASGQDTGFKPRRTTDGKPDFNGIWEAMNTANWNILAHEAQAGPVVALGAAFSEPGGTGVVEGGEIPYQPWAAAKKKENGDNWVKLDPEVKCYMPGVPRATYMPFPFQIVQSTSTIVIAYEFASANRIVRMNSKEKSPAESWMGWSVGHWEGDTLVIDVTDFNDQTWFDRAGDFHSGDLHVVERYTATGPNSLNYEATIEDPKVFTRPWKMSMPLYRHLEKNAQVLEYKCVPFVEELMYGNLRKKPATN
jgi:hypothetical protein